MRHYDWNFAEDFGVVGVIILIICCAFPFAGLPLLCMYMSAKEKWNNVSDDTKKKIGNFFGYVILGFVLIGSPIVTLLSIINFGLKKAMSDGGWFLALISLAELVLSIITLMLRHKNKKE